MIVIDKEMPESCLDCPCFIVDFESIVCPLIGKTELLDYKRDEECPLIDATGKVLMEEDTAKKLVMHSVHLGALQDAIGQYVDGVNASIDELKAERDKIYKKNVKDLTGNDTMSLFQLNTMIEVMETMIASISKWREKDPI